MAFYFSGTMMVLSAGAAYMQNSAANESAENTQDAVNRRYALKKNIAENQMEEQKSLAFEKMTETTRAFLKTKGTMEAVQAETMVSGNVAKRMKNASRREASEAKGQIVKVTNANIQNIAQDMLGQKVDTEAQLMEAESRKKSSLQMLVDSGIAGANGFISGGGMGGFVSSETVVNKSGVKGN